MIKRISKYHIFLVFIIIATVIVNSFVSFLFISSQAQAATSGRLLGLDSAFNPNDNSTSTTLVEYDQTTGTKTTVGSPIEDTTGGSTRFNQGFVATDPVNHRFFYYISNNPNGDMIIIQDTITGTILAQLPVDVTKIAQGIQYETSTGRLLGVNSIFDSNTFTTTTTLVSYNLTTGTTTTIGDPIENTIHGRTSFNQGYITLDSAGHRIFYYITNSQVGDIIIVQDTITGNILAQLPVNQSTIAQGIQYEPSTNRLLGLNSTFNSHDFTTSTTLVNYDLTTGATTNIGNPIENTTSGRTSFNQGYVAIDPVGHRFFYYVTNSQVGDILVVQDTQTGAVLAQLPVNPQLIAQGIVYETPIETPTPTPTPAQITDLSPAKLWMSHGTLDAGIKLDIQTEVFANGNLVSSGTQNGVSVGSNVGPNGITLQTIPFTSFLPVNFSPTSTLSLKVSVRNACVGSGRNSGTAIIWYNNTSHNSNFGATIANTSNNYYLRANSALTTSAGSGPQLSNSINVGAPCSPYQSLGTWSITQ
jgi:hypothetical protein